MIMINCLEAPTASVKTSARKFKSKASSVYSEDDGANGSNFNRQVAPPSDEVVSSHNCQSSGIRISPRKELENGKSRDFRVHRDDRRLCGRSCGQKRPKCESFRARSGQTARPPQKQRRSGQRGRSELHRRLQCDQERDRGRGRVGHSKRPEADHGSERRDEEHREGHEGAKCRDCVCLLVGVFVLRTREGPADVQGSQRGPPAGVRYSESFGIEVHRGFSASHRRPSGDRLPNQI